MVIVSTSLATVHSKLVLVQRYERTSSFRPGSKGFFYGVLLAKEVENMSDSNIGKFTKPALLGVAKKKCRVNADSTQTRVSCIAATLFTWQPRVYCSKPL